MLKLSREKDEVIVIVVGDQVIRVKALSRGRQKIGVDAPDGVIVDREEIYKKKQQESVA